MADVNKQKVDHSARHIESVTPSDSVDLTKPSRYLSLTVAGTIKIITVDGQTIAFPTTGLAVGVLHPIAATRVYSTDTAATGIFAYA